LIEMDIFQLTSFLLKVLKMTKVTWKGTIKTEVLSSWLLEMWENFWNLMCEIQLVKVTNLLSLIIKNQISKIRRKTQPKFWK